MAVCVPLILSMFRKPASSPTIRGAGHRQLGQRLQAALDDGASTVSHPATALEHVREQRVVLQALQFVEWRQVRILVGEVDDDAEGHLVVLLVVEERTHPRGEHPPQGPAHVVQDAPRHVALGVDVPKLLEPDAVMLRAGRSLQVKLVHQLLAEVAAAAFREDRVLGVEFVAGLKGRLAFAAGIDAHVLGGDALNAAVVVVEDLRRRETGEHIDAGAFRLFAQPTA